MRRSLLLPIALLLLLQMASQASAAYLEGLTTFEDQIQGSYYPDPENLLQQVCTFCGHQFCQCLGSSVSVVTHPPPITINPQIFSQPAWPQDPNLLSPQSAHMDYSQAMTRVASAPGGHAQYFAQPSPSLHKRHASDPDLQRPELQAHSPSHVWDSPFDIEGMVSSTYNAGDRTQSVNQLLTTPQRRNPPRHRGYVCTFCQQTFNRDCDLRRHSKTHNSSSTRPYACDVCHARFHYPKDVTRHRKVHESQTDKVYCPHADCKSSMTGFGRVDNLNRHIRNKHSGSSLHSPHSPYAPSNSGTSTQ